MCVNCVAGSVPYVGAAVGGLRLLSWRARVRRIERERAEAPDLRPAGDATEIVPLG